MKSTRIVDFVLREPESDLTSGDINFNQMLVQEDGVVMVELLASGEASSSITVRTLPSMETAR